MEMQNLPSRVLSFSRSSSSLRSYDKLDQKLPNRPFHPGVSPTDDTHEQTGRSRRRCFFASVCCLLALIATIGLGTFLVVRARNGHHGADSDSPESLTAGSAAIAAACNTTMFPDLCFEWLSANPSALKANPLHLAGVGVKVALDHVHDASALASNLNLSSHHVNLTKQAIEDCIELMDLSSDQLNDSMAGLNSISLLTIKSSLLNVKTKLSGTMGFQLACSEGLLAALPKDGSLSALVESQDKVGKGVIISLGLVDTLSKLGADLTSWKDSAPKIHLRRLMSIAANDIVEPEQIPDTFSFTEDDGFPVWLSAGDRKLLQVPPPSPVITSTPASPPPAVTSSPASPPPSTIFSPSPPASPPPTTPSVPPSSGTPTGSPSAPTPTVTAPSSTNNGSSPSTSTPVISPSTTPSNSTPTTTPLTAPLIASPSSTPTPAGGTYDAIVAQDGSGNYKTIQEALNNVPKKRSTRYTIYIKKGLYQEYLLVPKAMNLLTLVGDGQGQTIITGDKSNKQGITTYKSATVAVSGPNFIARRITFRNTAGPEGHQAVALRVNSDQAVFDSCSFEGYQDTLYALANRQFYTGCNIYGTVDFIFGNAIAVFQNCNVLGRLPLPNQRNTFTAQGRKVSSDPSGYSFQKCTVGAAPDLQNAPYSIVSYFGRPWKAYSRTVFLQCNIGQVIDPAGWLAWDATNPFTDTLYYGEYQNTGAGAGTASRIAWKGVHPAMSTQEAQSFTVDGFISGSSWLPTAEVKFQTSL
ncbi:hypothetical protein GOP47_0023824 [Adiantum capillus-veneris]|uniref:Pectinesterase inhibitor domain-containing protein n=1 Tax=Adiantum capillus-veneris TaxID=13818 RepID=A0A9D4U6E2_ADICA|nr:hypothetical protein GOP47_0023824 [Adiantum capillus-veneris]